jgi:hypothetical protein
LRAIVLHGSHAKYIFSAKQHDRKNMIGPVGMLLLDRLRARYIRRNKFLLEIKSDILAVNTLGSGAPQALFRV